jgi:hypothetical protein
MLVAPRGFSQTHPFDFAKQIAWMQCRTGLLPAIQCRLLPHCWLHPRIAKRPVVLNAIAMSYYALACLRCSIQKGRAFQASSPKLSKAAHLVRPFFWSALSMRQNPRIGLSCYGAARAKQPSCASKERLVASKPQRSRQARKT